MTQLKYSLTLTLVACILAACGGGGGGSSSGGGNPYEPPPPPPPAANTSDFNFGLNTLQVVGGSTETGTATAAFTLNEDNNSFSGQITLTGISADAVRLLQGFAGEVGTEILALTPDNATTWSIPANTSLSTDQRNGLDAGQIYVEVTTSSLPEGALRGQIIPDGITLIVTAISERQSIPPTGSSATAIGFITLNDSDGSIAARVVTNNFPDATIAHIHQALAGLGGGILINLNQDTSDTSRWSNSGNEETLDASGMAALNAGELYFNFHSSAFPAGEIRGQIVPEGIQVTFTDLTGDDVVMAGMTGVTTDASAVAASTLNVAAMQVSTYINTQNLDDASSATLNQAPAGQNGPSIFDFSQDPMRLSRWLATDVPLSASQLAAFNSQGLYFTVTTPDYPDGEVRGQLVPEDSTMGSGDSFQVTAVVPANAAEVGALPSNATFTFNRDVLAASLTSNTVTLTASGGDGSFGEANDVPVGGISSSASANTVVVDFNGLSVSDDIYQLAIADNELTDTNGILLDGDNDGTPGGVFTSTFNIVTPPTPPNPNATFTAIQNTIFTPICSECHGGGAPSAGMSLEAGQAYANIVDVASGEQPSLKRIDPNDPNASYLIRKLEGGPGITGSRMPLGGPFLSQSVIDDVREWVSNGALNN